MNNYKPIILVESKDEDTRAIEIALNDIHVTNDLVCQINIDEAYEYLRDGHNPMPCMILLDLNMPRMGAFEFLKTVKADDLLKKIPIVVLISSEPDENVVRSFGLDVAGNILKPFDYKQFTEAIRILDIQWALSGIEDKSK